MDWFRSYYLGQRRFSKEMSFGSQIDKLIQDDPTFLPTLPRYEKMQWKLKAVVEGIHITGTPDGVDIEKQKVLADYKTGKEKWTDKRAKDTDQLKIYLYLIYENTGIKPEEFINKIHWLPTRNKGEKEIELVGEEFFTFEVKHTLDDVMTCISEIPKIVKEMEAFYHEQAIVQNSIKSTCLKF